MTYLSDANGDFITMVQDLRESGTRGRTSTEHTADIKRAICDAISIVKLQDEHWQHEGFGTVPTIKDRTYLTLADLPQGLAYVIGDAIFYNDQGLTDNRYHIYRATQQYMEWYRSGAKISSIPDYWNFHGSRLEVYPAFPDDTSTVTIMGVFRPQGPTKRYVTSPTAQWQFYDPYSGQEISDKFSNFWFQEGYTMILGYAMYLLHSRIWRTGDDTAQQGLSIYAQARQGLMDELHRRNSIGEIEPNNLDYQDAIL